MRRFSTVLAAVFAVAMAAQTAIASAQDQAPQWSIAIHGGAGTIARADMTPEQEAGYRAALQTALDAGKAVLAEGGTALDAIEAAILLMEDDPRFNAGKGAVFTWEGGHELDASIMEGKTRNAGSVAGVTNIRHPILAARRVMTDSPHVMLAGRGAEEFAASQDLEIVPGEWFDTDARRDALERMKADRLSALDVDVKFGTVGAVALDMHGDLAAGTSTGGMTGKRWSRVGDAPIIGAGTYADNRSCAVSATGWGEYFIRVGVAHEICARLRFLDSMNWMNTSNIAVGADEVTFMTQLVADEVMRDVKELGGDGGVILVTPAGDALYSFNTAGMYRGRATSAGVNEVAIYGDE